MAFNFQKRRRKKVFQAITCATIEIISLPEGSSLKGLEDVDDPCLPCDEWGLPSRKSRREVGGKA